MIFEKKLHTGLDALLNDLYGFVKRKTFSVAKLGDEAADIHGKSLHVSGLDDQSLRARIEQYRAEIRLGKSDEFAALAMALVAEASFRSLGIRPHVEQLMGSLGIYRGYAVQMETGEGKTITAAIAGVLAGFRGKPCHIVTVNDYLAERDAEWMGPLYRFCGVRVGFVVGPMSPEERKKAYGLDVVYSTGKELLADYLRDMISEDCDGGGCGDLVKKLTTGTPASSKIMRGLHTAFVDEADSVLADEATVPLIISAPGEDRGLKEAVAIAGGLADSLRPGHDYKSDEPNADVRLTASGRRKIEDVLQSAPNAWKTYQRFEYLVRQALCARLFFRKDVHYIVNDEKIVIVDEKTGRTMPDRTWRNGLHQAVEAREGLPLSDVSEERIKKSFQSFFRSYKHLAGLSGTLQNVETELWSVYGLSTVKIPPHAPKRLKMYQEKVRGNRNEKQNAVIEEIRRQVNKGKAVLVGTRSVKESEEMHRKLEEIGIGAEVLNALHHESEAAIIARAGRKGQVTIATNMAGRGTDISVEEDVVQAGGLHVIVTERHESRRVDMQLIGRAARQGRPGSARLIVCLEDEIMRKFAPLWIVSLLKTAVKTAWGQKCALPAFKFFQYRAEKARCRLRKEILRQDMKTNRALSFTKF